VIDNNAEEDVTWLTSYVSLDRTKTFCIYDGPSHEAIHRAATANELPVDAIDPGEPRQPGLRGRRRAARPRRSARAAGLDT